MTRPSQLDIQQLSGPALLYAYRIAPQCYTHSGLAA